MAARYWIVGGVTRTGKEWTRQVTISSKLSDASVREDLKTAAFCVEEDCRYYNPLWAKPDDELPAEPQHDAVNNPAHYTSGEIECIDAIRSALTEEEFRGFCKGSALQYVWRERLKGGGEDLSKAAWYLGKLTKGEV